MRTALYSFLVFAMCIIGACSLSAAHASDNCGKCRMLVNGECRWCYQERLPCIDGKCLSVPKPLTVEHLKNAEYRPEATLGSKVKLMDGRYEKRAGAESTLEIAIWMTDQYAFGDLNGDGLPDAAVVLASTGGGTGTFVELVAVINDNGTPRQAAVKQLGDRVGVKSLSIRSGRIEVDLLKHRRDDPMCCPSLRTTDRYRLAASMLVRH